MNFNSIKRLILFFSISSSIVSLFFLFNLPSIDFISIVVFIPALYGILYYILIPSFVFHGPGWFVINIIMFLRYVLFYPFYVLIGFKSSVVNFYSNQYIFIVFVITILELLVILITSRYFLIKFSTRQRRYEFVPNRNLLVLVLFSLSALFVVLLNPAVLLNFNFVFDTTKFSDESFAFGEQDFVFGSGVALEYIKYAIIFFNLFFFEKFLTKYNSSRRLKFLILSTIPFLVSSLFYIGISRSSILIPFLAYLALLLKYFKQDSLRVLPILSIYIGVLIISLTIYKQFRTGSVKEGASELVDVKFLSDFLNDYTSSFPNVYSAFVTSEEVSSLVNSETIVNDYISILPYFHRYANMTNRTVVLFNKPFSNSIKTSHRILPLNIQGVMHLGFPLFVMYSFFAIFIILKLDSFFLLSNNIYISFVFAFVAVGIGFSIGHTFSFHVVGRIFRFLIPMLSVFLILNFISRIKI